MNPLKISLAMLFEPVTGFEMIKRERENFSYEAPIILFLLVLSVRVASIFMTHYPLASVAPADTNIGTEMLNMILPLLTWVIGSYLITTINDGECVPREVLAGVAFAMIPYIIFTVPLALASRLMSSTDFSLYSRLQFIIWAWVILLQLIGLSALNTYSFWQTLKIAFASLFACVFIWAVFGLIYILGENLFGFIANIFEEYKMLLFP